MGLGLSGVPTQGMKRMLGAGPVCPTREQVVDGTIPKSLLWKDES